MTTYRWKSNAHKRGDAQAIGQALMELSSSLGDRMKTADIVTAATNPQSPLHSWFTWDDAKAANLYRRQEANILLASIQMVGDDETPQPMFISVVEQIASGEDDRAYVTSARVFSNATLTAQVLERAYDEMETFRQKYGQFKELAKIADDAQSEITTLMKGHEVTSAA